MTLELDHSGRLYTQNQVTDYVLRGDALENYSVLDFFMDTYESTMDEVEEKRVSAPGVQHVRGRPRHERVRYQTAHPKSGQKVRIIRREGHNTCTVRPFFFYSNHGKMSTRI